jgi:hypothetical protein
MGDGEWVMRNEKKLIFSLDAFDGRQYFSHHPSPITHHPSPITHHPSPITHHPSPITHHPSPLFLTDGAEKIPRLQFHNQRVIIRR